MRALSVRQPWAQLIAYGHKTIELRSWPTQYRGRLLICASLARYPNDPWPLVDGPRGMAVCTVILRTVRPVQQFDHALAGAWASAKFRWAWVLEDPQRIEPFPVKGRQGLFTVDVAKSTIKRLRSDL